METSRKDFTRMWSSSYSRRLLFSITALISVVVIVSAGASYLVMRNQISRMAGERTRDELRRTAAAFSTMFASSIIPASEQVFETPEVNNLIYGSSLTDQQLVTATQLVDRFQLANPLIDSISVYNSQRSTVYSTRYGISLSTDPRNADVMRIVDRIGDFKLYRFIPRVEAGKPLLTVILGSRPFFGDRLLGGLIVNVSEAAIGTQLLGRRSGEGSRIAVLDSAGVVLFDTASGTFGADGASYPLFSRVLSNTAQSGSFNIAGGRAASLVSFYREPLMGWTFVSSTPNRMLFAGIARWSNEIIFVFAALLAISIALALSASRRVSVPLERLMHQARSLQTDLSVLGTSSSNRDDLSVISETMELLNQRLHDLLHESSVDGRSMTRVFARALQDHAITDAETDRLQAALFDAASGEISVVAVAVDGLETLATPGLRAAALRASRRLALDLERVAGVLAVAETEKGIVAAAVATGESGSGPFDGLRAAIAAMGDPASGPGGSAGSAAGVSFTAGVSDPFGDLDELPGAYDAAVEAVRYRFRFGTGAIIRREQCRGDEGPFAVPDAELRRLGEQARLLNRAAVDDIASALLEAVRPFAYEDFVFLTQNMLHVLERVFADSGLMSRRELDEYRAHAMSARWVETTENVRALALRWFDRYCDLAQQHNDHRVPGFVADVKRVIEIGLLDPDLSAKSIASRMKSSVNYVRSTFKRATGDSISNYITRLRIDRCKEMLENTGQPVKIIAQSAGFRNYNYFFTLFKKQTGRTPQEYQRHIAMK